MRISAHFVSSNLCLAVVIAGILFVTTHPAAATTMEEQAVVNLMRKLDPARADRVEEKLNELDKSFNEKDPISPEERARRRHKVFDDEIEDLKSKPARSRNEQRRKNTLVVMLKAMRSTVKIDLGLELPAVEDHVGENLYGASKSLGEAYTEELTRLRERARAEAEEKRKAEEQRKAEENKKTSAAPASADNRNVALRYGGGYFESNAPQQFIGRVVVGGNDTAMIYTSPTLAGFYAHAEADLWDTGLRYAGEFGGFRLAVGYSDGDGDEYRRVEADPAITTGFVWIDPLDSGIPFAVGLGGTNLAWDARTSTQEIDAAATALYMQYRSFSSDLVGGVGVGVMANYRNTEHRTRIENLDFAGFAVNENYNFDTFAFGPRAEASLEWDCDPEGDGPYPSVSARLRAMTAFTHDWRRSEVSQRATGPFFGAFDYAQRVKFDDDGFNLRYGVDATVDVRFDSRTTAFVKVGWQGQSDAPTIVPADGSFAPGAPIRADTESADEWYAGVGLRTQFDF